MTSSSKHLLLLPMPAFGHVLPQLEFARQLSKHHKVTLAVSAFHVQKLHQRRFTTPVDLANPNLHVFPIQDGAEDFDMEDPDIADKMAQTIKCVNNGVEELMQKMPVRAEMNTSDDSAIDIVIADPYLSAPASACVKRGVGLFQFHPNSTTMTLPALLQISEDTPTIAAAGEMAPGIVNAQQPMFQLTSQGFRMNLAPEMKKSLLEMKNALPLCRGIIFNDIRDLEEVSIIEQFSSANPHLSIRIIGPLLSPLVPDLDKDQRFIDFLNRQKSRSVVYISFGSMFVLSAEQIVETGEALLAVGKPVIWSLPARQRHHLPAKLENRVDWMVEPWVPQRLVLEHESTGVFITHAGWNSVLEALFAGVPMVCWPMGAEQHANGQRVERMKVGEAVEQTAMNGRLVGREEIVTIVNRVRGEEFGMAAREIRLVRDAVKDRSSARDMHLLVSSDFLMN